MYIITNNNKYFKNSEVFIKDIKKAYQFETQDDACEVARYYDFKSFRVVKIK